MLCPYIALFFALLVRTHAIDCTHEGFINKVAFTTANTSMDVEVFLPNTRTQGNTSSIVLTYTIDEIENEVSAQHNQGDYTCSTVVNEGMLCYATLSGVAAQAWTGPILTFIYTDTTCDTVSNPDSVIRPFAPSQLWVLDVTGSGCYLSNFTRAVRLLNSNVVFGSENPGQTIEECATPTPAPTTTTSAPTTATPTGAPTPAPTSSTSSSVSGYEIAMYVLTVVIVIFVIVLIWYVCHIGHKTTKKVANVKYVRVKGDQ